MSDYLAEMKSAGIEVNWLTLLIGLGGPGKHAPVLDLRDVEAFATKQLESSSASDDGAVAVVVAAEGGLEETRAVLRKLANEQNLNAARELRKWRAFLLRQTMKRIPSDPLYGLLALTEFWERFDFPVDSPHVVQGRGNSISPPDYYTEESYRASMQRHLAWIDAEIAALRRPEA